MTDRNAPAPDEVSSRARETIRNLDETELAAIMASAQRAKKAVLPGHWDFVKAADPDLARTLDLLHAQEVERDLPRFEALAAGHRRSIARAVKGPAGQVTAGLIVSGLVLAAATALLLMTGVARPSGALTLTAFAVALLGAGYVTGHHLAHRNGKWLFADAALAASTVWDAGIDAAAALALSRRDGKTEVPASTLKALTAVWSGAGLDPAQLSCARGSFSCPDVI